MRNELRLLLATGVGISVVVAACSASDDGSKFGDGGGGSGGNGGSGASTSTGPGGFNTSGGAAGGGSQGTCDSTDTEDKDKDGWTKADGDCNDCDPNVNPGAIEVIVDGSGGGGGAAPPADEDCDGVIDNVAPGCDDALAFDDQDPKNGAHAIDICQDSDGKKWGIVSATYTRANGVGAPLSPAAHGIYDNFGANVNPQQGSHMLVLSSGFSRLPGQPNAAADHMAYQAGGIGLGAGQAPPNFPQGVPNCPGATNINDDVALDLKIKVPSNATGYRFKFKFYSFEFAEWVCTDYNDQFIALVNPPPMGSLNGNITFDAMGNPVSVNIAFFDVCDPVANNDFAADCFTGNCPAPPNPYCPLGPGELTGNGFDNAFGSFLEDAGGTTWLQTQAPVDPGSEIDIRFAIWDTGDEIYDSTVLVDGFEWIANGGTVTVGTDPIPDPK